MSTPRPRETFSDLLTAISALALPGHEDKVRKMAAHAFQWGRSIGFTEGQVCETAYGLGEPDEQEQADIDAADAEEDAQPEGKHASPEPEDNHA
jgi:hypothetical protein